MTRNYLFTLVDPTVSYRLWEDLILATISDPTYGNSPFIPSSVCELQIQMPGGGPNSANNMGRTVSVQDAGTKAELNNIIVAYPPFRKNSVTNSINLKAFRLQGSAANVTAEVTFTCK